MYIGKRIKSYLYLAIGVFLLILTVVNTGFYRDDEFHSISIFFKYRPTFKLYFYSPVGMSDKTMDDLSPAQQNEMEAFNEFVRNSGILFEGDAKAHIPILFVQLTLSFLVFGILSLMSVRDFRVWLLFVHCIINLVVTGFGIAFGLVADSLMITLGIFVFIVLTNFITGRLLITKALTIQGKPNACR